MKNEIIEMLVFALIIISIISLSRKIYLEDKLSNEKRRGNIMIIFNRIFSITRLFPIAADGRDKGDLTIVKQANRAIKTFYVCFTASIVFAFIDAIFA